MKESIGDFLYRHYVLTLTLVVWGLGLFTAITLKTFFDPVSIPAGTATALATVYAIVPLVVGIFKWRVDKKGKDKDNADSDSE